MYLLRDKEMQRQTCTQGEGQMTKKAEIRAIYLQTKKPQRLLATPEAKKKVWRKHVPDDSWVSDFWPLEL